MERSWTRSSRWTLATPAIRPSCGWMPPRATQWWSARAATIPIARPRSPTGMAPTTRSELPDPRSSICVDPTLLRPRVPTATSTRTSAVLATTTRARCTRTRVVLRTNNRGEGGQPPFPIFENVARSKWAEIMKTIIKLAVWLALSALTAAAQMVSSHAPTITAPATAPATIPDLNTPVVKVNGTVLTERDLREQMQRLFPYYSIHGGKVPEKYQGEIRQKATDRIIADELVYQEAKRRGMHVPPEVMAKVFHSAKARFGSEQAYQDYGKQVYGSVAEFERRIRRATL